MKKQTLMRLFLVLTLLLSSLASARAKTKHLLVVTVTYGFPHNSIPTAENVLTVLGAQSGAFTVDIVRSGPRPKDKAEEAKWEDTARRDLDEKMTVDALKQYDGVIFANTTGDCPCPTKTPSSNGSRLARRLSGCIRAAIPSMGTRLSLRCSAANSSGMTPRPASIA
jgi:hypothetical protein